MKSEHYDIVCDRATLEDVLCQVRPIKTFPCVIKIYDRAFRLDNAEEHYSLIMGLEVGYYLSEERQETFSFENGKKSAIHWHKVEGKRWEKFSEESKDEGYRREYHLRSKWHEDCAKEIEKLPRV